MVSERVVVTRAHAAWVRLRVHGLLRNPSLASALQVAARLQLRVRIEANPGTGSIRAPIAPGRDALDWMRWISVQLDADSSAPAPTTADPPAAQTPRPTTANADPPRRARDTTPPAGDPRPRATSDRGDDEHALSPEALAARVGAPGRPREAPLGLHGAHAAERLARDGRNEIADVTGRTALQILVDQYRSVPVALLGASGGLALATRAFADAGAIGTVLLANGALGFATERTAERTVSSLRRLAPRQATVVRDGQRVVIDARDVVVGDLLVLAPGDPVAADARVLESHRLATNEAALTGESLPVRKIPVDALPADTPLGERRNMVYTGTVVSGGTGLARVVATGERTALGGIRRLAQSGGSSHTQLQLQLDALGRRLAIGAAVLCGGVFAVGLLRGRPALPLLRTTAALGVAAIPEGLPTVATSLLASGIRSLRARGIYARSLDAVENLGAVDTVCFDKTGTLTLNRMAVTSVSVGLSRRDADALAPAALPEAWCRVAALCNSVERDADTDEHPWQGSSTELALLHLAIRLGTDVDALRRSHPVLGVRHRSEHHPYMVTLHAAVHGGLLVAVKGRPDAVLERCERWWDGNRAVALREPDRAALLALNDALAARGERVLALAWREQPKREYGETAGLCWLGLAGLSDPLRDALPEMIGRFQGAGIRPMMITGDQHGTASAVARAIGLDAGRPIADAGSMPESAAAIAGTVAVAGGFARSSPAMKLEIVRALQARGHVVAMTGDGINDGPALRTADVGVAMGATGTDFAHAMSDLVLKDDHPAALLVAIEEGRTAFVNVRKAVRYLVATNLSELATTAACVSFGLPDPFDPLALLWINLVTDVWPAIALGLEPAEPGILERPPVSLSRGVLERDDWIAVGVDAGVMTAATLASFGAGLMRYGPTPRARTMAFCTLTASQLLYALAVRSRLPIAAGGMPPNPRLARAVLLSLVAQAGTVALPPLRGVLRTAPLGAGDLLIVVATATLPLAVRELLKAVGR